MANPRTLAEHRASGPFTTRWYNDPVLDGVGRETGATTPVWSIAPDSVIVSPAPEEILEMSVEREVWGWTWADSGIRNVYVRAGDGEAWRPAELEPRMDTSGSAFQFAGLPRGAVQPGWPQLLRQRADSCSRRRAVAMPCIRWRQKLFEALRMRGASLPPTMSIRVHRCGISPLHFFGSNVLDAMPYVPPVTKWIAYTT